MAEKKTTGRTSAKKQQSDIGVVKGGATLLRSVPMTMTVQNVADAAAAVGIDPDQVLSIRAGTDGWSVVTIHGKKLRGDYHAA